jgi:hypothetical protein
VKAEDVEALMKAVSQLTGTVTKAIEEKYEVPKPDN